MPIAGSVMKIGTGSQLPPLASAVVSPFSPSSISVAGASSWAQAGAGAAVARQIPSATAIQGRD